MKLIASVASKVPAAILFGAAEDALVDDTGLDDVTAVTPTLAVRVAGGLAILSGGLSLVVALQATAILQVRGVFQLGSALFAVAGILGLVSGFRLTRMRAGAALMTCAVAGSVLVLTLSWFVLALAHGVFILLALPMLPISGVAAITSFSSRSAVARADQARKRLRAQGLDVGL